MRNSRNLGRAEEQQVGDVVEDRIPIALVLTPSKLNKENLCSITRRCQVLVGVCVSCGRVAAAVRQTYSSNISNLREEHQELKPINCRALLEPLVAAAAS